MVHSSDCSGRMCATTCRIPTSARPSSAHYLPVCLDATIPAKVFPFLSAVLRSLGFIYADERTQTRILQASKELISVTIQDVLRILGNVDQKGQGQATSADIERVSTLLRAESPQSKFRNLFVKLHRSAENGNAEDRESLLAIVNVVPWSLIPGFDVLQYPSTLRKKLTKS